MSNRFLFAGLASLLFACSDSPGPRSGADVSTSWFSVANGQNLLSVTQTGYYEFLLHPEDGAPRVIKRATGELEESAIDQLKQLLAKELRHHYYANRTADEQRCHDEGGYSLVHGGGCWIVDEVTDTKTKQMLDVLVPLFQEKEAEAREVPDTAVSDASVPPMTTLGTPHR